MPTTYPPLPPGVKTFDIRRVRRHHRKAEMLRINRFMSSKLEAAEKSKAALANLLENRNRETEQMRRKQSTLKGTLGLLIGAAMRPFRTRRGQ